MAEGEVSSGRSQLLATEVFHRFPYGLLVLDRWGALIERNPAAEALLGPLDPAASPRCCQLLGCRSAGILDGVCLSERASDGAVPEEIRVDLPRGSPAEAAWVTVAKLGADGRFVVQLRPADPRDRRRRTGTTSITEPGLRVFALGHTRLESNEGQVGGSWLERRAGQLLRYLVCERRRVVHSEEIAEAIWPETDPSIVGTVRYFVHKLRRALEPKRPAHGPSSFILAKGAGYRLNPFAVWVDADEFEDNVRAGIAMLAAGRPEEAAEKLEKAVALYRGEFLADEPYANWAQAERERLRDLAEVALRALVQLGRKRHDLEAAAVHMRRLGELEPLDVDVQRQQIALCLARGRRSEAMRRYSALKGMLRRVFGEEIDFDLSDLARDAQSWHDGSGEPVTSPSGDR